MEPIQTVHMSKATIDRLLAMIREGYWGPGDRLPPQRELARTLGIGMSTLREALQSLQAMGVLEMHHGEGTFVTEQPYQVIERILGMSLSLGDLDLQSLFEARIVLEGGLAYHASVRASDEQIAALFRNLEEQEKAIREGRMPDIDELDLDFHRKIAEMAGNNFLQQVAEMLLHTLEQFLRSVPHTPEGLRLHKAIAEAIRMRKPQASSEAVRKLMETTETRYMSYFRAPDGKRNLPRGEEAVAKEDGALNTKFQETL
jgi:GntR family transcriptional repressor for pyruvate dehydrogenase complex